VISWFQQLFLSNSTCTATAWEAKDDGEERFLATWFSRPRFCADEFFLLRTALNHPGAPADLIFDLGFPANMDAMVSTGARARELFREFQEEEAEAVRVELKAWYVSVPDLG
jgi:hypothetical protein